MNYYRRYMADYLSKTADLSIIEHGAYSVMLDVYYSTGKPLPSSLTALYRICRAMTPEEQIAVQSIAERFFPAGDDGLRRNPRADKELGIAEATIDKQRKSGAESAKKRWSTDGSGDGSTDKSTDGSSGKEAIQPPTTNHQPPAFNPQPPTKVKNNVGINPDDAGDLNAKAVKTGKARADAKKAIAHLNAKAGTKYRDTDSSVTLISQLILVDGATLAELLAVVDEKVKQSLAGDFDAKYLRPETLFNATKFESYRGQIGTAAGPAGVVDKKCGCGSSLRFGSTDGQCNPCWRVKTYGTSSGSTPAQW